MCDCMVVTCFAGLGGFVACRSLSQRNNDPTKASRPWDVVCSFALTCYSFIKVTDDCILRYWTACLYLAFCDRDGFVMGEGAGVLLLEELDHAKVKLAFDKSGTGIVLCIEKALAESGVSREDVNYVNAHATSTLSGDLKEYQALMCCFGKNPEVCD
ncbi:hypothetical protein GW17_00054491 [Ensete ventricosum]|uniref:beta-ketoacyl-[acyl-carrier-protein] synthase I n=1 Tax=Ensete ventricosum TaxID=4639 RepID=A0A426XWJ0_ENSVE|nr:hypothetical protein B296_00015409 [Ensete ventricosum]RWV83855.1 hypothetical protein GW17_00054491 [Ensete ventricosum]RZR97494.1 hypothetical protein BHM03_00026693 [Ensete ventricosum]